MQAFGLMVIDFDGGKISTLADSLRAQGLAVTTGAVSVSDTPADGAPVGAAVPDPAPAATAPDNGLPHKCPACGATYPEATICAVQHEPTKTQPTEQVLNAASEAAGAQSGGDAPAEPSPVDGASGAAEPPMTPPSPAPDVTPAVSWPQ